MSRTVDIFKSRSDRIFSYVNTFMLVLIIIVILYPLIFVISASFSSPTAILRGEMWLLPKGLTLQSYRAVLREIQLWRGYRNTLFYTLLGVTINLVMTIMGAYPLSRKDLVGRNLIMFFILFTMFFSGGLVPTYLIIKKLRMVNTIWALVVPGAISVTNLIIARSFFINSIPFEIQESALIDGASNIYILCAIVLPLSKPIIAVLTIYYGVAHWNSYFLGLIYLTDSNRYPLQLVLRNILLQNQMTEMMDSTMLAGDQLLMQEGLKYSIVVVASVPVLLLYPFLQRYFVKGVMIGAIKG